jgi:hypothetical protein
MRTFNGRFRPPGLQASICKRCESSVNWLTNAEICDRRPVDKVWKIGGQAVEKPVHLQWKSQGWPMGDPCMSLWVTLCANAALRVDKV